MKQQSKFKITDIGKIPEDWETGSLGDYVKIIKGISYRSEDYCNEDEGLIFINLKCVARNGGFRTDGIKYYKGDLKEGQYVTTKDIIIANTDLTQNREIIGSPLRIPELNKNKKMCISLDLSKLEIINDGLDNNFLYYYLMSSRARQFMVASSNGTTVVHLSTKNVPNMIMPLPKIDEQKRIGKMLSSLDHKIDLNNRINSELEQFANSLFKQWFVNFKFPKDKVLDKNSKQLDLNFEDEEKIPDGWKIVKFESLVKHSTESINPSLTPEVVFEHYSLPSYDLNKLPTKEKGELILSKKYVVKNNSILISKLNPRIPRVWPILRTNSDTAICSTEFQVFIPNEVKNFGFIHSLINSDYFQNQLTSMVTGTSSSHQRVRPKDILNIEIVFPSEQILLKFNQLVNPLLKRISLNIDNNLLLEEIKRILISNLMKGTSRLN